MVGYTTIGTNDLDKALDLDATDEGAVGDRMPGFYAGYFRDPDGNQFCAFCMGSG